MVERNGTERRTSGLRETAAVVAASITSELVILALFAIVRVLWPSVTPDVGALIRHGGAYLRGHYGQVAIWTTGMLTAAVVLAYAMTWPWVRRRKLVQKICPTYPHSSAVSAWWLIFEEWRYGRDMEVCCILDDGSAIRGQFASFNNSAGDSPDRDLCLLAPIRYRPPGGQMDDYPAGSACISARSIVILLAGYDGSPQITPPRQRKRSAASAASPSPPVPPMAVPVGPPAP